MPVLNSNIHPKLTADIITQLRRKQIKTLVGFVVEDCFKLVKLTGLSYKDVQELKQTIKEKFGGVVKNPVELLSLEEGNIVPTGIRGLDELLKGGLRPGHIYELSGISGCGKTQLCLTITINISLRSKGIIRYIDTKRDFSSLRVIEVLNAKSCIKNEMDEAMDRIKVSSIYDLEQLFSVIRYITSCLKSDRKVSGTKLIIIDSLPGIIFKSSNNHEMNFALNHIANALHYMTNEFHVAVITVNLITRWNQSVSKQTTSGLKTSVVRATLGKYWSHVPNTRLLIEKLTKTDRKVTVWESSHLKTNNSCGVRIHTSGVN